MDEFEIEYQKYLSKLEILKEHNNLDFISSFFLNSWKRKFQENKDKELKNLNYEEVQNKILEDEKSKIKKNHLINEHIFLEYFQYKYEKHSQKINIANDFSRTSIFNDDRKENASKILKISS